MSKFNYDTADQRTKEAIVFIRECVAEGERLCAQPFDSLSGPEKEALGHIAAMMVGIALALPFPIATIEEHEADERPFTGFPGWADTTVMH